MHLSDTNISLTTNVCLHVVEYSALTFDYTLNGPFNKSFPAEFSPSSTLFEVVFCFYLHLIGFLFCIITLLKLSCQQKKQINFFCVINI